MQERKHILFNFFARYYHYMKISGFSFTPRYYRTITCNIFYTCSVFFEIFHAVRQAINVWFINVILKWLINTLQPFSIRPLHVIELIPWFAGITSAFPIWYQKVESSSIFLNNYSFTCKNMCVCTQGVSEYICLTLITRACITSIQWQ